MIITFTGHRNRTISVDVLDNLRAEFPGALWVQGGADGVDTAVSRYAAEHSIRCITVRPDWRKGKKAPLARNEEMVDVSDLVVAVWDGREYGGTYYTKAYADRRGVPVRVISPA